MTSARTLVRIGAAAILATGLFASAMSADAVAQGNHLEDAKVSIGISITDSTFLPIYIAEKQGYFKDEGLDASFNTFRGGSDLVRALVAGSVNIGLSSPTGVVSAIKAGQDVKVFFGGFNQTPFYFYAIPSVKTLADAKGKRFGISRFGSSTDALTRFVLKAHGLDPDKDVKIIQGGNSSARLAAMEAGQVDAGPFAMPFNFVAADRGYNLIASQSDVMPDFPIQSFYSLHSYINGHRNTIKAVLRAFIRGIRETRANKALAVQTLISTVHMNKKYADVAYQNLLAGWREDGRLASDAGMKAFFDMAVASGDLKEAWPKDKYWDNEFVATIDQWKPK